MAFFRLDPDAYLFSRIGSGSVQPWPGSAALPLTMVKDGCSFHYTHTWSKSDISICWRHLVTSKESSNPILFLWKCLFLHHACATWAEQLCYIKIMTFNTSYYIMHENPASSPIRIMVSTTKPLLFTCSKQFICKSIYFISSTLIKKYTKEVHDFWWSY